MQDGLASYEQKAGRGAFYGAEVNLANAVRRIEAHPVPGQNQPAWQRALENARLPLYDLHWTPAIVIDGSRTVRNPPPSKTAAKNNKKNAPPAPPPPKPTVEGTGALRVGLKNGTTMPLSTAGSMRRDLKLYDVVYVTVNEGKKDGPRAELRIRPQVQGAAIVIDNATGKILAMVGGFSYPLSQLNRTTQARRQPGSALKPLTYLAALTAGLQPDTMIDDEPITLPPIGGEQGAQEKDYWTPKNYDGNSSGTLTLRQALEQSKNQVTARLLDGGIAADPPESLDKVCAIAMDTKVYTSCERYYPFVLGSQPVRPIDLALFYASVANEGGRPTPYAIESIEQDGKTVYTAKPQPLVQITTADRPALFQLKTMLQGVLARGTAASLSKWSAFVGGKTGTSDEENDAWFVGFSNQVTIAVWVGYDNADMRNRRTLGGGRTGGNTAIPIFAPIMQAVWNTYAKQEAMRGPSKEAAKFLVSRSIDRQTGERLDPRMGGFTEWYRADENGRIAEAPQHLDSRYSGYNGPGGANRDNPFAQLFNFFDRQFTPGPGSPRDSIRMRPPPGPMPPPDGRRPPPQRFDFFDRMFR